MADIPIPLRKRIVEAYTQGLSGTYTQTAELFGVGPATVSRLLRRYRETGSVEPRRRGGNNPRRVDLDWLREHARAHPEARLIDRVHAWEQESGVRVSRQTMSVSMRAIGWTYKKRHRSPANETARTSVKSERNSPKNKSN